MKFSIEADLHAVKNRVRIRLRICEVRVLSSKISRHVSIGEGNRGGKNRASEQRVSPNYHAVKGNLRFFVCKGCALAVEISANLVMYEQRSTCKRCVPQFK